MNPNFTIGSTLALDVSEFIRGMKTSEEFADRALSNISDAARRYLGAGGLLYSFNKANQVAMQFGQVMADTSAITELSVEKMATSLKRLDNVLGEPARTGYTLYETISAGIKGTEDELIKFVEVSGKTAKAIRSDIYTTSNALTTMMHAYGVAAADSQQFVDLLYTTVKEGKAHGDELSRTLGLVMNNASEAGVSMRDLMGSIAALSRTMTTSNAMISLNQLMNSFLGPTAEAKRVAREFGIELSIQAIQSKGFAAVMEDIHNKVGGNAEAIKSLFGNIRAARGALALTGSQYENFVEILEQFDESAGKGEQAFKKQTETMQASAERFRNSVKKMAISIGDDLEGLTKTVYKTAEAVTTGFSDIDGAIKGLFSSFGKDINQAKPGSFLDFLKNVDELTAKWSRFFIYMQIGVSAAKSLRTAIVLTMDTMKKLEAERKRIEDNKAAAKLKEGADRAREAATGAAADGAKTATSKTASASSKIAADMKMSTGEMEHTLREMKFTFNKITKDLIKILRHADDTSVQVKSMENELKYTQKEFSNLVKQIIKINRSLESLTQGAAEPQRRIEECMASMRRFRGAIETVKTRLNTLAGILERMPEAQLNPAVANSQRVSKAATAIRNNLARMAATLEKVSVSLAPSDETKKALPAIVMQIGASVRGMSSALNKVAKSMQSSVDSLGRSVMFASTVTANVKLLERRLQQLNKALSSKSPAVVATAPVTKTAPTTKTTTSTAKPKTVPEASATKVTKSAETAVPSVVPVAPVKAPVAPVQAPVAPVQAPAASRLSEDELHKALYPAPPVPYDFVRGYDMEEMARMHAERQNQFKPYRLLQAPPPPIPMSFPKSRGAQKTPAFYSPWPRQQDQDSAFSDLRERIKGKTGIGGDLGSGTIIDVNLSDEAVKEGILEGTKQAYPEKRDMAAYFQKGMKDAAEESKKAATIGWKGAISGFAKAGMAVWGMVSAVQIGWSIGKQISDKFKFEESRLYMAIADLMVGKTAGSTRKEQQSTEDYNTRMMATSAVKRIELLYKQDRINAIKRDKMLEQVSRAYTASGEEAKRILDNLNTSLDKLGNVIANEIEQYGYSVVKLMKARDSAAEAYNKQAERLRDMEEGKEGGGYSKKQKTDIQSALSSMLDMAPDEEAVQKLNTMVQGKLGVAWHIEGTVRDALQSIGIGGGSDAPAKAAVQKAWRESLKKLMESKGPVSMDDIDASVSIRGILKGMTEEEAKGMDVPLFSDEMKKKLFEILNPKSDLAHEARILAELEQQMKEAETNLIVGQINRVADTYAEGLLKLVSPTSMEEINAAVKSGFSPTATSAISYQLQQQEADMAQASFSRYQEEMNKFMEGDEFKSKSQQEQERIKRSLNFSIRNRYNEILKANEAAARAAAQMISSLMEQAEKKIEETTREFRYKGQERWSASQFGINVQAQTGRYRAFEGMAKELDTQKSELTSLTGKHVTINATKRIAENLANRIRSEMAEFDYPEEQAMAMESHLKRLEQIAKVASSGKLEDVRPLIQSTLANLDSLSGDIKTGLAQAMESMLGARFAEISGRSNIAGAWSQVAERRQQLGMITQDEMVRTQTKYLLQQMQEEIRTRRLLVQESGKQTLAYAESTEKILGFKSAIKEIQDSVIDRRRELRSGAMGAVQSMIGGKIDSTNLHHAMQIMGMVAGPAALARLTAPPLDSVAPWSLNKAQGAQRALSESLDSYIMSQRYEQANVGKTVAQIYNFIRSNNAIVLR